MTTKWIVIVVTVLAISIAAAVYWIAMRPAAITQTQKETWFCPMHPEVTSEKPGTCHICGMPLEKKQGAL